MALPATASASVAPRPLLGPFGPAAQPAFVNPGPLAFDGTNGDLLLNEENAANEKQKLTIEAASNLGGTYELSYEGQSTGWQGEATLSGGESGTGDIAGTEGKGKVTSGSTEVTEVSGTFSVGETIEGEAPSGAAEFEPGAVITAVNNLNHTLSVSKPALIGTNLVATLRAGSLEVTNVTGGPFTTGRTISGAGIQLGTTITAVGAGTLTLSKVPIQTTTGVALTAGSLEATAMHTSSGALVADELISGTGIQPGTTVTEVNEGAGAFKLSLPPTSSGVSSDLSADLPFNASRSSFAERTTLQEALAKLPGIGAGNVEALAPGRELTPTRLVQYVEFHGALEERPLATLACDPAGLTGASPTCTVEETVAGHRAGIYRFHEDGTPAPFAALGTNLIDGRQGYGGKPCGEEAESCDETPQGSFEVNAGRVGVSMAVDESSGATAGDVYVGTALGNLIDAFAADGHYLGQIAKYKEGGVEKSFGTLGLGPAVGPEGALYVSDFSKNSIHKYVSQGAPHNPLTVADSVANCTATKPGAIAAGAGPSAGALFARLDSGAVLKLDASTCATEYEALPAESARQIAVDPASGHLLVAMQKEAAVNEYDASGASATLLSQATLPGSFDRAVGIAVGPASGELYASLGFGHPLIETYGPSLKPQVQTGAVSGLGETSATLNGTVNPRGNLLEACSFEWGLAEAASFEHTEPCAESPGEIGTGKAPVAVHLDLTGLAQGARYRYRLVASNAIGSDEGEAKTFTTPRPPAIEEESILRVTRREAQLQAEVNPEGFATAYRLQYGIGAAFDHSTPVRTLPADESPHRVSFTLQGLLPGSTYRFRVLAENTDPSLPGTGEAQGEERVFHTFGEEEATACPANEAFRSGPSAALPDCRAYEMVSPLDKEGGDIAVLLEIGSVLPASVDQSSTDGNRMAYGSYRAFGDAASAPYTSQYIASRGADGWASHGITPPRSQLAVPSAATLWSELYALSGDLCQSWIVSFAEPPLAPEAIAGKKNLYRRVDQSPGCGGDGGFEAITTLTPPHELAQLALQGTSANGTAAVYFAFDNLPGTGAPDLGGHQAAVYYRSEDGQTHYVCFLPSGEAITGGCSAGMRGPDNGPRRSSLWNAISEDGQRVFWTAASEGPGRIYLRENPAHPEASGKDGSGNCIPEPERACTIAVSKAAEEADGSTSSTFWGADPEGTKVIFNTANGNLCEFNVATKTSTLIAHKSAGLMGASEDLSYIYFASEEAIPGVEPNSEGDSPVAGKPNLYVRQGAEVRFVATLVKSTDVSSFFSAAKVEPARRTSRVSPNGLHAAFMSTAGPASEAAEGVPAPTGYDNRDANSGAADTEVYLYDATAEGGQGKLICASCNPSGARPAGEFIEEGQGEIWAAGHLPVWQSNFYAGRLLSEDGRRLFFESIDALSPNDTNGVQDVYQWEAPGTGSCAAGSADYSPLDEGCVSLISSGKSPEESIFADASPDGRDVFFTTLSSLLPQDYGLIDLYDARAGGGFPAPPAAAAQCEGEACQPAGATPARPNVNSLTFEGAGNVHEAPRPRCPKGSRAVRRHGKAHCAKPRAKGSRHRRRGRGR